VTSASEGAARLAATGNAAVATAPAAADLAKGPPTCIGEPVAA